MTIMPNVPAILIVAGLALMSTSITSASIVVSGVGFLSNASESRPFAMSSDGTIVSGFSGYGYKGHAFLWSPSASIQDLGTIGGYIGTSWAYGISGDGTAVVGRSNSDHGTRAFRWTNQRGMEDLGVLTGGYENPRSEARDASFDGSVVVGSSGPLSGPTRAFIWESETGMRELPAPTSPWYSTAIGVSSDGRVVAGTFLPSDRHHACRWLDGVVEDLGSLYENSDSTASAISDDGRVVVGTDSLHSQGFRWTAETGMISLGSGNSFAWSVSGDGEWIGGSQLGEDQSGETILTAYLWNSTTGIVNLGEYLNSLGVDTTGWEFFGVNAISSDGSAVAGEGAFGGEYTGFVITGIPSPGPAAIGAISGMCLLGRRRR